ncbi:hypothetical protein CEJ42_15990 [Herbaspirillum robiniae]|uniref:HTH cro/C1-type domain-containing protein n=2 Tax=Herbaspirillum robiniae TaxID=2014887 RepID=A0A246WP40_9BURK|nr:hypothetical protein CEJ42_15990 [Herbaspirillum robiniae]
MAIHERLRSERLRLNLAQGELARIGEVAKQTQVNYESGLRVPNVEYLVRVQAEGVDIDYVISGQREQFKVATKFNWELLDEIQNRISVWEGLHTSLSRKRRMELCRLLYVQFAIAGQVDEGLLAATMAVIDERVEAPITAPE